MGEKESVNLFSFLFFFFFGCVVTFLSSMGSLMSGWDSHPLDDQKGNVFWEALVKFSSARLSFCILGRCEVWS